MRIISGKHKGKRLTAPSKLPVRPTTDIAKEALFNIINNRFYFSQLRVLDLFAGTGNISFEFASRYTEHITAIDSHFGCVKYIDKVSNELEMPIQVIKSDVFSYLEKVKNKNDVIFADPPYDFSKQQFEKIVTLIFENELLEDDGVLIIEHSKHTDFSNNIYLRDARKYGGCIFSFFEYEE